MSFVRLFVLPVFQRHYLFHVSVAQSTRSLDKTPPLSGSRWHRLVDRAQTTFRKRLAQTWTDFEKARSGTWRNTVYRLAQRALAREDPHETSFKKLPNDSDIDKLFVTYPASLKEAFVRRRLRILIKRRRSLHRRSLGMWCVAIVPMMPLMVTPFPNLPLYYAIYRIYSNYVVTVGCTTLLLLLQKFQRDRIKQRASSQPMRDGRQETPVADVADDDRNVRVVFEACSTMETVLKPQDRMEHPVSDDAVLHISRKYQLPDLLALVARTRRKATGAMFPHEFS